MTPLDEAIVTSNDETTAATPQRIDLEKMRKISDELFEEDDISDDLADVFYRFQDLLNELEKMYAREDALMIENRALHRGLGSEMKFPVEVLVIDEYMEQFRAFVKRIKTLRNALQIIRDDLDELADNPIYNDISPISNAGKNEVLKKIRNFANDASQ